MAEVEQSDELGAIVKMAGNCGIPVFAKRVGPYLDIRYLIRVGEIPNQASLSTQPSSPQDTSSTTLLIEDKSLGFRRMKLGHETSSNPSPDLQPCSKAPDLILPGEMEQDPLFGELWGWHFIHDGFKVKKFCFINLEKSSLTHYIMGIRQNSLKFIFQKAFKAFLDASFLHFSKPIYRSNKKHWKRTLIKKLAF